MELEEIYKQIEQATIDLCPKWKDCAAERNMRNNLLKYIKLNQEKEARIKELKKEVQHRKAAQESLNFELSVRSAKIKELGTQLQQSVTNCNKWVSVKDRLPDECESVLLYNNADNGYAVAWAEKINGVWEFCDGEYNYPTDCFTHWMPLPNPPTVSKTENVATAEDSSVTEKKVK